MWNSSLEFISSRVAQPERPQRSDRTPENLTSQCERLQVVALDDGEAVGRTDFS